jgi:hypothetical protein
VVFGDETIQPSDDFKQCTVHAFPPYLSQIRINLPLLFGEKAENLNAEGNHYFEEKSGIGFHGDAERRIVMCCSLGKSSILRYAWRYPKTSEHTLPSVDLKVEHGDLYIMSEKATGYDWKQSTKLRIVHAAGSEKYINPVRRKVVL